VSSGQEVGVGVIGCGGIGRWHATSLRQLPGIRLIALADPDRAAREGVAHTFGVPVLASAEALLARDDIELVSICTPPHAHAGLIEAAAAAGKHVLVEKPMATTLADADRALAACRTHRVQLGVVHQQRAQSSTRALHQLATDGAFGRLLLAAAHHTWFKTPAQVASDGWRGDAMAGGGLLLDQAVHAIDLLVWFLGEPEWVSGASATLAHAPGAEDTAIAMIGFTGGALAVLAAGAATNRSRDDIALELSGTRGGFRLEIRDYDAAEITRLDLASSDDGRARSLSAGEIESLVEAAAGRWRRGPAAFAWRLAGRLAGPGRGVHPFRSVRGYLRRQADRVAQRECAQPQGHAEVLARMAAAVRGEGAPLVTGDDARRSLQIIEAIRRSHALGGQRVELVRAEPA
jgi:UDP-N-acetyl-2-amino-2-deoxyglucuronate dehydrogenase